MTLQEQLKKWNNKIHKQKKIKKKIKKKDQNTKQTKNAFIFTSRNY